MATTVTLTIADADAARVVAAAKAPGKYQNPNPAYYPPAGTTNAAIIKNWLIGIVVDATVLNDAAGGGSLTEAIPSVT